MSLPAALTLLAAGLGGAVAAGGPLVPACTPPLDTFPFCNTSLTVEQRIDDLLQRIPDAAKPNLLTARGGPHGMQNFSAIGVPSFYWGTNCLHSVGAPCTSDGRCPTNFPSGPSLAATFDTRVIRSVGATVGRELRALYNIGVAKGLSCWGPVVNLNRDPRWGRNGEGGAEDPHLMGELAASWTRGFQNGDVGTNETAGYLQGVLTLKHYVANSLDNTVVRRNVTVDGQAYIAGTTVTRHTVDVRVRPGMLQNYLAAFRAAAKAGARGQMCSYNAVNGIPTCLSPVLKRLRELWTGKTPWGGYVTSDSDSVADAVHAHHYVNDSGAASCMAVRDGGDDVDSGNTYFDSLLGGVAAGHCSMTDVDAAVRNTLRVRFEMGLFDPVGPQPLTRLTSAAVGTAEAAALNERATAESLVLLKNTNGTLPLRPGQKIAMVGPHANASRFLLQVDTGQVCGGDGTFDCVTSPFAAIQAANEGGSTTLAVGCDVINATISTPELRRAALAAAAEADTVVLALGIAQCGCMGIADTYMGGLKTNPKGCATSVVPPYTPWDNCWGHQEAAGGGEYVGAEAHDRVLIDLPPVQRALAADVLRLGKPTVLVLVNGGSVDVGPELAAADAAVEAFYPGVGGATAVANALFSRGEHFNRFGRMPYTVLPASFVNETSMMEHDLSAPPGRTHMYYTGAPVVPFGFGLSLTTWAVTGGCPAAPLVIRTDGSADVNVTLTVANTGARFAGDVVVTAFWAPVHVPSLRGSRLRQRLWAFERAADVAPGGSAGVTFAVGAEALASFDPSTGAIVASPGSYEVWFADGSGEPAGECRVSIEVTGPLRVIEPFPSGAQ